MPIYMYISIYTYPHTLCATSIRFPNVSIREVLLVLVSARLVSLYCTICNQVFRYSHNTLHVNNRRRFIYIRYCVGTVIVR